MRPDLRDHPDFVHLLDNAGYNVQLSFKGEAEVPMLAIKHGSSPTGEVFEGTFMMRHEPPVFKNWLDELINMLGLHKGFTMRSPDLLFWGFELGKNDIWLKKKSSWPDSDVLHLDPRGIYGGRLLSAYDSNGDELREEELYGPVSSLEHLEWLLRNRGWLGVQSEPL